MTQSQEFVRVAYGDLLTRLRLAVEWVGESARVDSTRLSKYLKDIKALSSAFEGGNLESLISAKGDHVLLVSLHEAMNIVSIHEGLCDYKGAGLRKRLRKLIEGPACYVDENKETSSNRGRDIEFELLLASKLRRDGLPVSLEQDCDLVLDLPYESLYIECKRPFSGETITCLVDEGIRQLKRHLTTASRRSFGLVAVSVDKVLNPEFILPGVANVSQIRPTLVPAIENVLRPEFPSPDETRNRFGGRIIGLMGCFTAPLIVTDSDLPTYASETVIFSFASDGHPGYNALKMVGHRVQLER